MWCYENKKRHGDEKKRIKFWVNALLNLFWTHLNNFRKPSCWWESKVHFVTDWALAPKLMCAMTSTSNFVGSLIGTRSKSSVSELERCERRPEDFSKQKKPYNFYAEILSAVTIVQNKCFIQRTTNTKEHYMKYHVMNLCIVSSVILGVALSCS